MRKTMMFLVAAIFLMSSVCLGAKIDLAKVAVPRDSGRIVETYVSPKADAPVIAYVQDIHVNYEAQKAEVAVIEALIRDYGFDLVLVEGKKQDLNTDLKKYRKEDSDVRLTAGEELLKNATITGIEYLDMVSDYNFTIQGIEDMNLYKAETEDHVAISGKSGDISKLISALQNITNNLKLHIYTKEMRDLDDKIAAYDKDEIGLIEYAKFLETEAKANNTDVKTMTNLSLFIDSANLEGQINFPAVETERQTVFAAAEKALTGKAKDDLTAANLKFRTGDMTQAQFYTYLKDAAEAAKVDLTPHKNLSLYTRYITTYEKIDTTFLFKEIDQLVDKLKTAMTKTPEQKKLSQIDKGLAILADFANTKLIPDEYNYYTQNKAEFDLKGWLAFLKTNSANFKLTNPVPDDISIITSNLPVLERFYSNSLDRDRVFMQNIAANLQKYGKDKAVLITGGFHTVNMKKLLRDNGYSYVVIAPRVDVIKDYSDIYKKRMNVDLDYANSVTNPAATNPAVSKRAITHGVDAQSTAAAIDQAVARVKAEKAKAGIPAGQTPPALQQALTDQNKKLRDLRDATADAAVRTALTGLINELQVTPDQSWVDKKYTNAQIGELNQLAGQTQTTASLNQLPPAVRQGLEAAGIAVPADVPIFIIPQADMARICGEASPMAVNADGRFVIGAQDWALAQANFAMLGHEIAAVLLQQAAVPNAHDIAVQVENLIEARLVQSGNVAEVTAGRISQDARFAAQTLQHLQSGAHVRFEFGSNYTSQKAMIDAEKALLEARGITVETVYTNKVPNGQVHVTTTTAKGQKPLETRLNVGPLGREHRLPGIMNLGVVYTLLQADPTSQSLRDIATNQYNALVDPALPAAERFVLPADPTELIKKVQEVALVLPAPVTVNFNTELEKERTRQIFAVAA